MIDDEDGSKRSLADRYIISLLAPLVAQLVRVDAVCIRLAECGAALARR